MPGKLGRSRKAIRNSVTLLGPHLNARSKNLTSESLLSQRTTLCHRFSEKHDAVRPVREVFEVARVSSPALAVEPVIGAVALVADKVSASAATSSSAFFPSSEDRTGSIRDGVQFHLCNRVMRPLFTIQHDADVVAASLNAAVQPAEGLAHHLSNDL
ncbi:MAG: hypothetical protein ABJA81_02775 [Nocardioidaceae bacterium]